MSTGIQLQGRSWLTAKAYRALGHPVPDDVQDDEVIVLRPATSPPPVRWQAREAGSHLAVAA